MPIALVPSRLISRPAPCAGPLSSASRRLAAVLLFAGPALAHITVTPDSVPAGSTDRS